MAISGVVVVLQDSGTVTRLCHMWTLRLPEISTANVALRSTITPARTFEPRETSIAVVQADENYRPCQAGGGSSVFT